MTNPARLRQRLGPIGVWSFRFDTLSPDEAADAAMEIERLGFPSLWIPEVGRTEAMSLATHLLHTTYSLTIANGIARISDRSAPAAAAAHRYLQALSGGRHVLGLGLGGALSNGPQPIDRMTSYVDDFERAWSRHQNDDGTEPTWCLAAYNQRMVQLAGQRTDGVHTYLIDANHTAATRELVSDGPVVAAEMAVVLTDDPEEALAVGRAHLGTYLGSRSHQRKFKALGFVDADFADGGSDRLVSTLVVHGADAIRERATEHRAGGADHVGVQVLGTASLDEDLVAWATLARLVL
jgi:probable F420-dependent oxidoreductase